MRVIDDYSKKEEFDSGRYCDFCNSQEGKLRMVGNFVVELSEIKLEDAVKLACQSCKIKERNFRKTHHKNHKSNSFFKSLFNLGF